MTTEQLFQIEKELQGFESDLFTASTEYKNLVRDAAEKRANYDVAFAVELLKIKSNADLKFTVPEKEALTVQTVQGQMTACRIAEAIADGSKRHLTALQAILSSVQTRSKLLQTEWTATARQP